MLCAALLAAANACIAAPQTAFGIASMDGDRHLTLISAFEIDPATTVQLQFPDQHSRPQCCKRLRASQLSLSKEKLIATNKLTGEPAFVYQGEVPAEWADMPFIGAAAFGNVRSVKSRSDLLQVSDSKGNRFSAKLCTSTEGVHLTELQKNNVVAHLYLWLGYEVESPTCRASPADKQP